MPLKLDNNPNNYHLVIADPISGLRVCNKCKNEYPINHFRIDQYARDKDGNKLYRRRTQCGYCVNKYRGSWVKAKRRTSEAYNVYTNCKAIDRQKKRANDMTFDFVEREIQKPCAYCETTERTRSLDRKDSKIGHTMANSVSCCVRCNMIKRDMPYAAWWHFIDTLKMLEKTNAFGDWSPGNFLKNTPSAKKKAAEMNNVKVG